MSNEKLIQKAIEDAVKAEGMFTSVDISNNIKLSSGTFVRNVEVRDWLHKNFDNDDMFLDYTTNLISVMNSTRTATLYLPNWKDVDDYKNRDQHALTPAEVTAAHAKKPAVASVSSTPDITALVDQKGTVSKIINSSERIKVPGRFIQKLGYVPGDTVPASKIKTHTPIPTRLIVNKDYRLSIPRSSVNWLGSPVKVILKKDHIAFEKA